MHQDITCGLSEHMTSNATYSKHPQPARWPIVVELFHGIECQACGCIAEEIPSRLGMGNDPKEAGR